VAKLGQGQIISLRFGKAPLEQHAGASNEQGKKMQLLYAFVFP